MLLFVCTDTTESKPVKQETNCIVILPPSVSVIWRRPQTSMRLLSTKYVIMSLGRYSKNKLYHIVDKYKSPQNLTYPYTFWFILRRAILTYYQKENAQ